MNLSRCAALGLAPALLLGLTAAAPARSKPRVTFSSPAGRLPAGPLATARFGAVLPSGRIVDPVGTSVAVGSVAYGFAIAPDGRHAIVSASDSGEGPGLLVVVDTRSMTVVGRTAGTHGTYTGVIAVRDPADPTRTLVLAAASSANAVDVFDLGPAGDLSPNANPSVPIPAPAEQGFADYGHAGPTTLLAAKDGRHVFVVDSAGSNVVTLDVQSRAVVGTPIEVGFEPFAAALSGSSLLVANQGLMRPSVLPSPASVPDFGTPAAEQDRASSLSVVAVAADGTASAQRFALQMDRPPDGQHIVGGAQPSAIAVGPHGTSAFVAMSGVDRIATVALANGGARVVGGTELRLYDRGPYGTQPSALALSRDGSRLYVALAGINAVAVLDARNPRKVHRLGLLPTGWQPTALALSRDLRRLFVLNARGTLDGSGNSTATLQRIDLIGTSLPSATRRTLTCARSVTPLREHPVVPQVLGEAPSPSIKHIVLIFAGVDAFDGVLGDLAANDSRYATVADPALVRYPEAVTPNLHALAKGFGVAGNLYNDAPDPSAGDARALGGIETAFEKRTRAADVPGSAGLTPNDYPRMGYLYDSLLAHHLTYRDYGVLLDVRGAVDGRYTLDVPALQALAGNVDLAYPLSASASNVARANEFATDYARAGSVDFASVRLTGPRSEAAANAAIGDQDRALGKIVDFLTHRPDWTSTAIFVLPEAATQSRDHVDPHRSYALVISPYSRRGYIGMWHLSPDSVLKTEEAILGLPALSLGDALATDMSDFFTSEANAAPFEAAPVAQPAKRGGTPRGE